MLRPGHEGACIHAKGFGHNSKPTTELLNFIEKKHDKCYISGMSVKVSKLISMEANLGSIKDIKSK